MPRALLVSLFLASGLVACGDDASSTGGGASSCSADKLCLDVVAEGEPVAGRLGVVWFRFEGDVGHDPAVAFDVPFDPASTSVEIPYASVATPPDIDLACERPCADAPACPCVGDFRVGIAFVMVVRDANQSGVMEAAEISEPTNVVGIANVAVGYSDRAWAEAPSPFDATFPGGVSQGTGPYEISGNQLTPADGRSRFQLKVGPDVF